MTAQSLLKTSMSRRELCAAALAAGAVAHRSLYAQSPPAPESGIEDFFRNFTDDWVRHSPDGATAYRYFTGEEQDRLERQLTPRTVAWKRERVERARKGLVDLRKFNRNRITETQRVSADVMEWQLDEVVRQEPWLDYTFPLEQMNGANVQLVEALTVRHPLITEHDSENYLAALGQAGTRMEESIAEARRLADKNIVPPRFILQATIAQMQGFTNPPSGQNPFVTALTDKMAAMQSMSDSKRAELRSKAEELVGSQVYPAWKKAVALLQSQIPRSTDDAGLWRLKDGPAAYAHNLRLFTTTNLTPDQIHEIGLAQVARIESQMDSLLRRLGRTDGSVKDRVAKLSLDMQYPDPTSEGSRARIMQDIDGIIRDAEKRAALLFDKRPKAPVIAQPFPRFREANAAANYSPPAPDGSRPGVFQYPRRVEEMTKFGLKTVVYHETVPGHHFQLGLQVENKELPRFRQIGAFGVISAFAEGWGLYAERLAAESGWYGDDIEGLLGQLHDALFRARRLVVDTGLHAKRWTRQQAIDYGIEASEVERYVVWPGQACSYMIGQLKIVELRDKAKSTLGERFSFQGFHNTVLDTATVPLEILERQVDSWIRSMGGNPQA